MIHFQRGIEQITGPIDRHHDSLWSRMWQLSLCQSEEKYIALCRTIMSK